MKKNISNILTLIRVAAILAIFTIYELHCKLWVEISFALFVIGSISDYFDGYFARKYNIQSNFGTCFDPICDKIFVLGMLILLLDMGICSFFVLFLIAAREILVSGIREYLSPRGIQMPVTSLAKYKTGFQMASIGILLFHEGEYFKELFYTTYPSALFFETLPQIGSATLYIALFLTMLTGFFYVKTLFENLK